ncbi:hypothetical protein [Jannaschia formosa]|uniref:hypothetical protein n=1 Tax=Jannaschia formosa TaxID=2259592 RepID=UPI000E1B9F7D|nr:hypothetical protein [Jannaschia formosa]TFL18501.1 hypothetical protein DR046_08445 [Jannaschia formosa]
MVAVAEGVVDCFNPCARYAARMLETEHGLCLLAFADRPEGRFVGEIMGPEPVHVDAAGRLVLGPLPGTI